MGLRQTVAALALVAVAAFRPEELDLRAVLAHMGALDWLQVAQRAQRGQQGVQAARAQAPGWLPCASHPQAVAVEQAQQQLAELAEPVAVMAQAAVAVEQLLDLGLAAQAVQAVLDLL